MNVSIIIPTKDRPGTLPCAVRSSLLALPHDGELIVVDDYGSVPASETLRDISDCRLRVLNNKAEPGPSGARNFGVTNSTGSILFFLDDDDELVADYCSRVMKVLNEIDRFIGYGHCAALHFEADGGTSYHGKKISAGIYDGSSELPDRLTGLGMGFWIRREVLAAVGGIDESIAVNEDTDLCLSLAAMEVPCHYDDVGGVILRHNEVRPSHDRASITQMASAKSRADGFEYLIKKHQSLLSGVPKYRRLLLSRVLKYRSRARSLDGVGHFIKHLPWASDRWLLRLAGVPLLRLSILIRRLRSKLGR